VAHGFAEGVKLSGERWQTLLDDPESQRWYRPMDLLGEDDFSGDQGELTRTPRQRAALAGEIEASLMRIHAFWLPLRQAVGERQQSKRMSTKWAATNHARAAAARSSRSAAACRLNCNDPTIPPFHENMSHA